MKKRMLAVLLASVTACSLGGCAGEKKDTVRTVKIGLTLYDQYDTFISELVSWFNASASALGGGNRNGPSMWKWWTRREARPPRMSR